MHVFGKCKYPKHTCKKVGWEGACLGHKGGVSSLQDDGKDVEDARG